MTEKERENHVFGEKDRVEKISQIRELVFGAQDGLLVPLGVVSSIAGAFNNNHFVIVAGISEALAGAFSMATGAYLASQAERQVHISEMKKEEREVQANPEEEREELILLYKKDGLSQKDAETVVDTLAKSKTAFLDTMIRLELGIEPDPAGTPTRDAFLVGISYLFAAVVPLFPYFFLHGVIAIITSIIATLIALFLIGISKGKVATLPYLKSGLQVMMVGGVSGVGGYLLGVVLPHILGLK
jgi:VIT1/CCC1 family predicted Fe2+/Mn2+ transporter